MLPQVGINVSVPVLILIIVFAAGLIVCHASVPQWYRDTLTFGSALVGGGAAIYALLLNVQTRRTAAASRFVERYNEPGFGDLRKALATTIADASSIEKHSAVALLNFFEELAISVNSNEASDRAARAFFYSIVSKYFRAMETWITDRRKIGNQPTAYKEYENLYRRWQES